MSTAGVTDTTHSIGVTVEIGGMSLEPSDAVVDVLELHGVRKPFAYPLADGSHNHAGRG
jgi:hypothetical protein